LWTSTARTTIRVIRRGKCGFTADFSHTGHVHRAEGKSMHEFVGKLSVRAYGLARDPDYCAGSGDELKDAVGRIAAELLV
jgi:hypothetical protein